MNPTEQKNQQAFQRLVTIMDELREKCPWDRKQTFKTLRILSIEEMYELTDALLEENLTDIKEEVGDILLHMVFYSKIASEQQAWDIADALNGVCDKLIRRHPHIYGDVEVKNAEDVKNNWEKLKLKEGKKSVLSGVPKGLPALVKAYRLQEKTATVGFEWKDIDGVKEKINEEIQELDQAITIAEKDKIEEEFGDVLFSLVNYARFLGIDPEMALERTNVKFKKRFEYIEDNATKELNAMTLDEMDLLWNEAKENL